VDEALVEPLAAQRAKLAGANRSAVPVPKGGSGAAAAAQPVAGKVAGPSGGAPPSSAAAGRREHAFTARVRLVLCSALLSPCVRPSWHSGGSIA
jgi:hypothetical protein